MKFKQFIDKVSELMLYSTKNNDTATIKEVLGYFKEALTKHEYKRIKFQLEQCLTITSKQITLKMLSEHIKILELEQELDDLKNGVKK